MAAKKSAPAKFTVPSMSTSDGTEVAAILQDRLNALGNGHGGIVDIPGVK